LATTRVVWKAAPMNRGAAFPGGILSIGEQKKKGKAKKSNDSF
jgi:hypothetical protein